jgi:hypothetical protein
MKKVFLGILALSLLSGTSVLANGGKKKTKAKYSKKMICPPGCPKSHCPMMGN